MSLFSISSHKSEPYHALFKSIILLLYKMSSLCMFLFFFCTPFKTEYAHSIWIESALFVNTGEPEYTHATETRWRSRLSARSSGDTATTHHRWSTHTHTHTHTHVCVCVCVFVCVSRRAMSWNWNQRKRHVLHKLAHSVRSNDLILQQSDCIGCLG